MNLKFTAQGVPKEEIFPCGIPVRKEFYEQGDKAEAKEKLGIDPNHAHLLMMCGSIGCGPLETLPRQNAAGRICEIICGGKKAGVS